MFDPPERFGQHSEASFWRGLIHRLQTEVIDELVLTGITAEILGKGHGEHFGGADATLTYDRRELAGGIAGREVETRLLGAFVHGAAGDHRRRHKGL